jgi:outer membrane protein assembly factor BamD
MYPDSDKIDDANTYYAEIRAKLEKKYFEIAKTYYRTADYDLRNYKAAIQAFDNLLEDFLGTKFKEEALYYRLKAAHDFVLKSTDRRKEERIDAAFEAYEMLNKSFPESQFMEDSDLMLATLQTQKTRIDALIAKQTAFENSQKK